MSRTIGTPSRMTSLALPREWGTPASRPCERMVSWSSSIPRRRMPSRTIAFRSPIFRPGLKSRSAALVDNLLRSLADVGDDGDLARLLPLARELDEVFAVGAVHVAAPPLQL